MEENGYAVLDRLFSTEEMSRLDADLAAYEATLGRDIAGREVVFTQKIAERDENIRAFAQRDEFVAVSTALLGPDTDLYFNQKVYKNPEGSATFSWHQDDAYGPVEPTPYLTVWVAITDATVENGCISVLPGSYKRGLVPHVDSDFGLSCHSLDDPDQGVAIPVSAGSALCIWSLTMHKSGPNRTNQVRKAFVLQFSPLGMRHKASGLTIRSRIPIARDGYAVRFTR
jgi:ectoine hydroxylase-related dioxygenase (phytanoyl-CoA dioxygenase family)